MKQTNYRAAEVERELKQAYAALRIALCRELYPEEKWFFRNSPYLFTSDKVHCCTNISASLPTYALMYHGTATLVYTHVAILAYKHAFSLVSNKYSRLARK